MRISRDWLRRIAGCLAMLLPVSVSEAAAMPPQGQSCSQQTEGASCAGGPAQESGSQSEKPAKEATQAEVTYPDDPAPVTSQDAQSGQPAQSGQSSSSQSNPEQQPNNTTKPLGTAAAPYERTTGVAASRPAGAAIAPAKQRRTRSIFIRVSIIVGAAAAVGTVAALSKGSPSRPQ